MYPVNYEADFNPAPNRWTTFFRPLLAIPWIIVALFWGILFLFTHLFAWVAIIITGRYPEWLYEFNSGVVRFGVADVGAGSTCRPTSGPRSASPTTRATRSGSTSPRGPSSQSRLKAFFRLILALPMLIVSYAVNYMHLWVAVIAWLTIVFRGYQPQGVNNALTFVNSFYARLYGYVALLTDDYPPIGEEKANGGGAAPAAPRPRPRWPDDAT